MEISLDSVVIRADENLRLPSSALRVQELTELPDTDANELLRAVEVDPAFAAQLLKLANSPIYSRGKQTTSLDRAIGLLGFKEVGYLAIALAASKQLKKIETELLSSTSFWNHSLTTAILARNTARKLKIQDRGIFTSALLHDLGILIEIGMCTEEMQGVLDLSMYSEDVGLQAAENQILGFNHSEFAAILFENWGLPEVIIETAKYHHSPGQAKQFRQEVALIAWANIIEHIGTDADDEDWEQHTELLADIKDITGLEKPEDDSLLEQAQAETIEMIGLF